MDTKKFTIKLQEILVAAQNKAVENQSQVIDNAHLMLSIIEDANNLAFQLLKKVGANIQLIESKLEEFLIKQPKIEGVELGSQLSRQAQSSFNSALSKMKSFNDSYLTPELLLIAIIENSDEVSKILKENGVTSNDIQKGLMELRKGRKADDLNNEMTFDALEKYAINLNQQASKGNVFLENQKAFSWQIS